jgi:hypothetical protein
VENEAVRPEAAQWGGGVRREPPALFPSHSVTSAVACASLAAPDMRG